MEDLTLFEALTGGVFDRLNWQHSGKFDQNFSKKSNARSLPGGGGMGGFGIDRYIRPVTSQYKLYSKGSLSDKQVITIADEAKITVSSNMLLIYMFSLEAIVPRACASMTRGLE